MIDKYEYGIAIQTKSTRILRDIDLLSSINRKAKAVVQMTMTTFDEPLCKIIEPNVSTTKERYEALLQFKEAGIPTIVWLSPILPFINDTEENIRGILDYCIRANVKGIICFGMGVTLREGDREYFYQALDKHFPGLKDKYISTFRNSYEVSSPNEKTLMKLLKKICDENGILSDPKDCFTYLQKFPEKYEQISLFDMQR